MGGLGLRELPKILGSTIIVMQRLGLTTKFGAQLGFAKAHHIITRRRKGGRGPGLGAVSYTHLTLPTNREV